MAINLNSLAYIDVPVKRAGYLMIKFAEQSEFTRSFVVLKEDLFFYKNEVSYNTTVEPEDRIKLIAYCCEKSSNVEQFEFFVIT